MKIQSLGILGLGSRSTLFYIKELNCLYHKQKGGYNTCPFKMLNANFDAINNLLPGTSDDLEILVRNYLDELVHLKVDAVLIPNITLHETIDKITIRSKIIHPVHLTIEKLKSRDVNKIVLFGSLHTMESGFLKIEFQKEDIEVILPSKTERLFIDEVRNHIYEETENEELLEKFSDIIKKYTDCHAVVLACTELSIAWNNVNCNVYDMSRIQIEMAVTNID